MGRTHEERVLAGEHLVVPTWNSVLYNVASFTIVWQALVKLVQATTDEVPTHVPHSTFDSSLSWALVMRYKTVTSHIGPSHNLALAIAYWPTAYWPSHTGPSHTGPSHAPLTLAPSFLRPSICS